MMNHQPWTDLDVTRVVVELQAQLSAIAIETAALQDTSVVIGGSAKHALEGIERSISVMRRVILDAIDLKAIEAGRLVLDRRITDLRAVLANAVERAELNDRLRISTRAARPLEVLADEPRVVRAIEALIRVALGASTARSPITVRLDRRLDIATVSVLAVGTLTAQTVADVVAGDSEPQPDWDADQLALYVARHTIAAHGGMLGAEHLHDIGLRLHLELPLRQSS